MQKALRTSAALAVILLLGFSLTSAQDDTENEKFPKGKSDETVVLSGTTELVTLSELVQLYSEHSQRPVMYDPKRVAGQVSITAPTDGMEVAPRGVLLSALAEFRMTLVAYGEFDKIIPAAEAITMCPTADIDNLDEYHPNEYVRIFYTSQKMEANALRGALQNLTTRQGGVVNPIAGSNTLIIGDFVANIRQIVAMLKSLEQQAQPSTPDLRNRLTSKVIELKHQDGDSLGNTIDTATTIGRMTVGWTKDRKTLILTGTQDEVNRVAEVIKLLDKPSGE